MIGLGIDIGGTNTKIVAVDAAGKLVTQERFRTEAEKGAPDFVRRLSAVVRNLRAKYGKRLVSIGIGAAGDVDPENGKIRFSPNLAWRNVKLTAPLERLTGLPCVMENDANMAAWGAFELELGRKKISAIALTLGTGIGTGIILNGELFHGATGSAGEAGHLKIERDGRPCNCGGRGCLESYCGSYAIMARARELIGDEKEFMRKFCSPGHLKFNTICLTDAAAAGNKQARQVWAEMGNALGRGLAGMILLLNPDYVILTGGVSKAKKWFMPAMNAVLGKQQIETPFSEVKIKVSDDPDLGSHGAALFGLERARKRA
ncbi:MAG: ROK family protein [Elusimicrobia bacterium]|nr:ROK family protein [Elusimicrobiota bacterium]